MATQDMMKKKKRKRDSIGLSSSEKMELSKPPKDVLGLGQHLVRELDFENGVDTLGRWMAHHLAALMDEAENGATAAARQKAREEATETIIKIWEHRASLPGKAYPLAPYKDVLLVLERLRPTENPFPYFERYGESKKDQLAADLFDSLTRLIIALLLIKLPPEKRFIMLDPVSIKALNKMEANVLTALLQWGELFHTTDTNIRQKRKSKKKDAESVQVDIEEIAINLIENVSTILVELQSEFKKDGK